MSSMKLGWNSSHAARCRPRKQARWQELPSPTLSVCCQNLSSYKHRWDRTQKADELAGLAQPHLVCQDGAWDAPLRQMQQPVDAHHLQADSALAAACAASCGGSMVSGLHRGQVQQPDDAHHLQPALAWAAACLHLAQGWGQGF